MILSKSSAFKLISLRLIVELKLTGIGKVLSVLTGEHFEAKKILKWLDFFSVKTLVYYPFSNGRIKGILLLLSKVFNIDQYVFELVKDSARC